MSTDAEYDAVDTRGRRPRWNVEHEAWLRQREARAAVANAEDALEAFEDRTRERYDSGLWGETEEAESAALRNNLQAAYNRAGTPTDDRRVDV